MLSGRRWKLTGVSLVGRWWVVGGDRASKACFFNDCGVLGRYANVDRTDLLSIGCLGVVNIRFFGVLGRHTNVEPRFLQFGYPPFFLIFRLHCDNASEEFE